MDAQVDLEANPSRKAETFERHTVAEWEQERILIRKLLLEDSFSTEDVVRYLNSREPKFAIGERQLKRKLREWGIFKNIPLRHMMKMVKIRKERLEQDSKETTFYRKHADNYRQLIPFAKLENVQKRLDNFPTNLSDLASEFSYVTQMSGPLVNDLTYNELTIDEPGISGNMEETHQAKACESQLQAAPDLSTYIKEGLVSASRLDFDSAKSCFIFVNCELAALGDQSCTVKFLEALFDAAELSRRGVCTSEIQWFAYQLSKELLRMIGLSSEWKINLNFLLEEETGLRLIFAEFINPKGLPDYFNDPEGSSELYLVFLSSVIGHPKDKTFTRTSRDILSLVEEETNKKFKNQYEGRIRWLMDYFKKKRTSTAYHGITNCLSFSCATALTGLSLSYLGVYNDAEKLFEESLKYLLPEDSPDFSLQVLLWFADLHTRQGKPELARVLLNITHEIYVYDATPTKFCIHYFTPHFEILCKAVEGKVSVDECTENDYQNRTPKRSDIWHGIRQALGIDVNSSLDFDTEETRQLFPIGNVDRQHPIMSLAIPT